MPKKRTPLPRQYDLVSTINQLEAIQAILFKEISLHSHQGNHTVHLASAASAVTKTLKKQISDLTAIGGKLNER